MCSSRERVRWPLCTPFDGVRGQQGAILPAVIMIVGTILVLVLGICQFAAQDGALARRQMDRTQAFYVAEGGLGRAQSWLEAQDHPPDIADTLYPFGATPTDWATGRTLVWILPDSASSAPEGAYTMVSEATVDRQTRRVMASVEAGVFSDFLYFTDIEHMPGSGNPLWLMTGDVIDGPFFTNDQISIFGDPRFTSVVMSAYGGPGDNNINHNAALYYYNGSATNHIESTLGSNPPYDNPLFEDGFQLGSDEVAYPSLPSVFDFRVLARNGGVDLAGDYEIVLARPDPNTGQPMYGYLSYRKSGRPWTDVEISETNGVVFVNGGVSVEGVLDGRLTIVYNGNISIVNDVTYLASVEGRPTPECDDMLGLLSGADIVVSDNAANRNDCIISGALMALCNSFYAQSWNVGAPRGQLTVWGSIIQSFRGSVGTGMLIDDEPVVITGYEKDYHYDWRLQDECPPGFYRFLKTGQYKRLWWREVPKAELGHTPTSQIG